MGILNRILSAKHLQQFSCLPEETPESVFSGAFSLRLP